MKEKNLLFYGAPLWSISGHHELLEINASIPIPVKNVENLQQNYSSVTKNRDLIRTIFHSIGTFDQHIWYWIKGRNGKSGYLVDKFWCLWSGQDHGIETGHLSLMVRNFFVIFFSRQKNIRCHLGTRHFSIWAINLESPIPLTNLNQ